MIGPKSPVMIRSMDDATWADIRMMCIFRKMTLAKYVTMLHERYSLEMKEYLIAVAEKRTHP